MAAGALQKAVLRRSEEVEDVVWATADGDDLWQDTRRMYDSYCVIAEKRQRIHVLDRSAFTRHLGKLKTAPYGNLLQSRPTARAGTPIPRRWCAATFVCRPR